uniref:hypothetical protein n=1 Tax=Paractinoplanes polyasparticus TaxID=2856853 RepID=UPI001C84812C|nr:hypothetical protein [Actinoplanes polyasparticus]
MTFKNLAVWVAATSIVALGLPLVTASPASAAPGSWRAYGSDNPTSTGTSSWRCANDSRSIATDVIAQVCAVRGSGNAVQGAVIVQNRRSTYFSADAMLDLWRTNSNVWHGSWSCSSSSVAPRSFSVCFGKTVEDGNRVQVSPAYANNMTLPTRDAFH